MQEEIKLTAKNTKNKTNHTNSRSQIALAMSGHTITDLYASFIIGLIPILAIKFNLSLFLVGILTSITGIANSLTQPIFGYLADKYNPKYFLVSGPLFSAIFISLLPVMPSYYLVLVFLFFGNLSIAALHPPSAAMGGKFGGKMKGLANSIISFAGTFGYALGSFFIIIVIEKLGVNLSPLTMIPGIIMAIIIFKFINIPAETRNRKSNLDFLQKIRTMNKTKLVKLFLIFMASYARDIVWIALITFMPLYFTNAGIKLIDMGYILIIFTLTGGAGGILAGFFSDKLKHKTLLIQVGLLLSAPFIYLMFKTTGILPVIFFIITGFFSIATLPLCIRVSQDIFPLNMGLASSLVMGLSVGTASITMIFLGKVADVIGIQKTTEYLIFLLIAAAIILTIYPFISDNSIFKIRINKN